MVEKNAWRKIGSITGAITGIWTVGMLIFWLMGSQIFASIEALSTLEAKVVEKYITKEVVLLKIEPIKEQLQAQNTKLDGIEALIRKVLLRL